MISHSPASILLPGPPDRAPGPLEQALLACGHAPERCSDAQALALLAQGAHSQVALVALDASWNAPEAMLQRIRDLRSGDTRRTPLLVLAAPGAGPDVIAAAYEAGAIDVLTSPLLPSALQAKLAYFLHVHHTSSGQRRSEAALNDTRAELNDTLAAAELATWRWDVQTDRVFADQEMARMFNLSAADANGGPIAVYLKAIHPDDVGYTTERIDQAARTGAAYDVAYRVRGIDGAWRTVIARGQLHRDSHGQPHVLRGIVMDVTRQRATEEALRRSEERYRTLFDSVDVAVCVIEMLYDADGFPVDYRFLETNPAFVKHTGLDNAIGKTILELAPEHETHWFDIYGKVAASGQPVRFIDEAHALQRWYDVYATRIEGPGSARVAVLFSDITERVRADEQLRQLAADLEAADRRKSEFLATLAHELRNPLAPIRSGLQVLRLRGTDPDVSTRVHDVMERQLTHLVALVDDLLDVARITHGQIELKRSWIDLADVLASAVETSRPLIDAEQHTLSVDITAEALPLYADPTRLRQVVSNLLNNAAKYTPRGGRIVLGARREGDQAWITVADNGIGIATEVLGEVFDMFTQVGRERHRARGGLGIGLSLVRSLAELHGGSASADSAGAGKGSVFTVRLPLSISPQPAPASTSSLPASVASLRILVVDDNVDAAATLAELLGITGHTVAVANSGAQAVGLAVTFLPQVTFLDIGMPGMNGYQTARALRAEPAHAGMLLVALTGWGGEHDREQTRAAGFDHHLTKPVDLDALLHLLAGYAPAALPA
ncbi:ATP-binding protein [Massilia sp. CF038]|uniref:ATP-binding protein n=1 Tax=Massilia sp. CF038 TaxID=1881045 RepID=UPI0009155E37|nr:ATP-binding protein [Massilia sp. CF038]SHG74051.1 PAS domain S-box-containing protein [Massilia sp. CF038]